MKLMSTCASGTIDEQLHLQEFIAERLESNKHIIAIG